MDKAGREYWDTIYYLSSTQGVKCRHLKPEGADGGGHQVRGVKVNE
jgi:hypothetical protein